MSSTNGQGHKNVLLQGSEPSVPPKSTSREPLPAAAHDAEDEEYIPPVPRYPEGSPVLASCDSRLRMALGTCVTVLTQDLIQKRGVQSWEQLLSRKNQAVITNCIMQAIKKNTTLTAEEESTINQQISANSDEIAQHIFTSEASKPNKQIKTNISTAAGQRAKLSEILQMIDAGADYYKILGISRASSIDYIKKAHRELSWLHSDKTGHLDEEADRVMQELNRARDVLCNEDEKQKYDNQLASMEWEGARNENFGESFHASAYSREDGEEPSAERGDEPEKSNRTQVPTRSPEIEQLHNEMRPVLSQIFGTRSVPQNDVLLKVRELDRKIEDVNISQNVDDNTYRVNYAILMAFHKDMNRIISDLERGSVSKDKARIEANNFRSQITKFFEKSCLPSDWTNIVLTLIEGTIKKLPDSPAESPTKTWKPFTREHGDQTNTTHGSQSPGASQFEPNLGSTGKGSGLREKPRGDENIGSGSSPPVLIQQWPGPGFTRRGDKILGYKPTFTRFVNKHGEEEEIFSRAKFLIRAEWDTKGNTLRIASAQDVGKTAAIAYHRLPKGKKNDLTRSKGRYQIKNESLFKEIKGVCWVGNFCSPDRMPEVWVEIELYDEEKPDPVLANKPHLMTRSDLCSWLGQKTADFEIDQYITGKKIIPPWAYPGEQNGAIDCNDYMPLNYPPPAVVKRGKLKAASYGGLLPYNSTNGYSNMQRYLPNLSQQGVLHAPIIDDLTSRIEELTVAVESIVNHLRMNTNSL